MPTLAPSQNQARLFPDLRACLIHIGNGQHPLLVDLAKYRGHPALIVVFPPPNGGQPRALVVAPGCTATTAQVLATAQPAPLGLGQPRTTSRCHLTRTLRQRAL